MIFENISFAASGIFLFVSYLLGFFTGIMIAAIILQNR